MNNYIKLGIKSAAALLTAVYLGVTAQGCYKDAPAPRVPEQISAPDYLLDAEREMLRKVTRRMDGCQSKLSKLESEIYGKEATKYYTGLYGSIGTSGSGTVSGLIPAIPAMADKDVNRAEGVVSAAWGAFTVGSGIAMGVIESSYKDIEKKKEEFEEWQKITLAITTLLDNHLCTRADLELTRDLLREQRSALDRLLSEQGDSPDGTESENIKELRVEIYTLEAANNLLKKKMTDDIKKLLISSRACDYYEPYGDLEISDDEGAEGWEGETGSGHDDIVKVKESLAGAVSSILARKGSELRTERYLLENEEDLVDQILQELDNSYK